MKKFIITTLFTFLLVGLLKAQITTLPTFTNPSVSMCVQINGAVGTVIITDGDQLFEGSMSILHASIKDQKSTNNQKIVVGFMNQLKLQGYKLVTSIVVFEYITTHYFQKD
jgi:hypothetical protein